jgi:hypothetical protein
MIAGPTTAQNLGVEKKEKRKKTQPPGWDLLFHQFLHVCDKNKDRVIATRA